MNLKKIGKVFTSKFVGRSVCESKEIVQEKGGLQTDKQALICASRMRGRKPSACKDSSDSHSRNMRRAETVGV